VEQQTQGLRAEAFACVGEGAVVGLGGFAGRVQVTPDLGQGAVAEQAGGDDEPDDAVGGEVALAAGVATRMAKGIEDDGDGKHLVKGEDTVEDVLGCGVVWGGVDE